MELGIYTFAGLTAEDVSFGLFGTEVAPAVREEVARRVVVPT